MRRSASQQPPPGLEQIQRELIVRRQPRLAIKSQFMIPGEHRFEQLVWVDDMDADAQPRPFVRQ
jgi:hypothetical protein